MFTEVRNLSPLVELQSYFEDAGYRHFPHLTIYLELGSGIENLWNNLPPKRRQAIRKAIKMGLTSCVLSVEDLDDFYGLIEETYHRISFPVPRKSLFGSILSVLQSKGLARVVGVRHEGELVSVVVNLVYKDVIYAWYSGGSMEHTRFHSNEYVFWTTIEWGAENGFRLFNFGGGSTPAEMDGVRTFKERLGGMTTETGRYVCIHHRLKHKLATHGFRLWRAIH
jgi:lipid II:glycine glycyltransferase (peptidoglycan interpeptide bridge formation enzyme)